jgi:Resolvase, N terminal domain/Molybdopterin oxidoreductase
LRFAPHPEQPFDTSLCSLQSRWRARSTETHPARQFKRRRQCKIEYWCGFYSEISHSHSLNLRLKSIVRGLCHASSVAALFEGLSSGAVSAPFAAAADAEVIWVIGANPTINHPVAATFIKNATKRGAKLIVMDPRRQTLSRHATKHLQFKPGSDVAMLNAMINTIITEGKALPTPACSRGANRYSNGGGIIGSSPEHATEPIVRRAGIYLRTGTTDQNAETQLRELETVAARSEWEIVEAFRDAGVSGGKGRDKRPAFNRLIKDATARKINMIAAWSVDGLGRSLQDLVALLTDLRALECDL